MFLVAILFVAVVSLLLGSWSGAARANHIYDEACRLSELAEKECARLEAENRMLRTSLRRASEEIRDIRRGALK